MASLTLSLRIRRSQVRVLPSALLKVPQIAGFALNVHPFSWLGSPFDRIKGLEVAFRVLLASCPVGRRLLFGCWARRAAYRMGAHDDERQFSGCCVLCSALVYTAVHLYTGLNSPATRYIEATRTLARGTLFSYKFVAGLPLCPATGYSHSVSNPPVRKPGGRGYSLCRKRIRL